jgi:UDP-N-acetylmuramoyl-L-alanyl-D-glutamate--2,6-diaminopimelate ligase
MTLAELGQLIGWPGPLPAVTVTGIAQDSRRVRPGMVFVARAGEARHGRDFVPHALAQGAIAIVAEDEAPPAWPAHIPYLQVSDAKAAVAKLAAAYYGYPAQALINLGVTGTDGKTTTAFLLYHLLAGRYPTGLLSTAGIRVKETALPLADHFTTPEAPEVQHLLATFRDAGCSHAVIEASSHGLAQRRLDEITYAVGVWTNLSPEHLDFHKTFEAYREAKLMLMRRAALSVLNADDPSYPAFAAASTRVISYGLITPADWQARDIAESAGQLRWRLCVTHDGLRTETMATLPMIGRYNVANALAALAAAHALGLDLHLLLARLADFPGVPGRMQLVQREPFAVVVDFAHTAPALAKALQAVRPQTRGRLIVVVGAAGERDPGKRGPLGQVAVQYADLAIFTEEDHRSESLDMILQQMAKGAQQAGGVKGENFLLVPDRREAIRQSIALAQAGDLVLLAGKGHEATLERRDEVLPWDEVAEARRALAALGGQG